MREENGRTVDTHVRGHAHASTRETHRGRDFSVSAGQISQQRNLREHEEEEGRRQSKAECVHCFVWKYSNIEVGLDETFKHVLSEKNSDEARQTNMATPKAVVVQFLSD